MEAETTDGRPPSGAVDSAVEDLLDALDTVDADGWYPAIDVRRPWSSANPRITGEFARPNAIRAYLRRELSALMRAGATVTVRASRPALAFDAPEFFGALDEDRVDLRGKKLFLFGPERMALSLDRLWHYCGTPAESFQRHVLFTNYAMHVESFRDQFRDAEGPQRQGVQMPAWHQRTPDGNGVSLVNIGVGPSNAKTITDHLAVLRPDVAGQTGRARPRSRRRNGPGMSSATWRWRACPGAVRSDNLTALHCEEERWRLLSLRASSPRGRCRRRHGAGTSASCYERCTGTGPCHAPTSPTGWR